MNSNTHIESSFTCAVLHEDGLACVKCSICGEWIKPADLAKPCLVRETMQYDAEE